MSKSFSFSEIKTKRIPYRIIFWTAVLAGTLDIAAAIINSNLRTDNLSPKYKIIAGLFYGILIWLIMNLVVMPLSNVRQIPLRFIRFKFYHVSGGIADLNSVSHLL
jgi:uncharacterized membrane protein YagU involved in acid resistance